MEWPFTFSDYLPGDCSVNVAANYDASTPALIGWNVSEDADADAAASGSLRIEVIFTDWNQFFDVEMPAPVNTNNALIDLTDKLITAEVKVAQGLSPSAASPFGAVLYLKTGSNYTWGDSGWTNMTSNTSWVTLLLDTTNPHDVTTGQTFDPAQPMALGIQLSTGGGGEPSYCSRNYAVNFGSPVTTVLYIDSVKITPR